MVHHALSKVIFRKGFVDEKSETTLGKAITLDKRVGLGKLYHIFLLLVLTYVLPTEKPLDPFRRNSICYLQLRKASF